MHRYCVGAEFACTLMLRVDKCDHPDWQMVYIPVMLQMYSKYVDFM